MENSKYLLRDNFGYVPEVIGFLASIKEFEYSYKFYCVRHPGGIFNLQIIIVVEDLIEILEKLSKCQTDYDSNSIPNIDELFTRLIYNFFKFIDSCYEIILGCCKEHTPRSKNEPLHEWLKKNEYGAGILFYENTKEDLAYFRELYNKLKHTSNSLQSVTFYEGKSATMGFYLQSVASDGSIGPDENLHPKFQDTHSASSYNYTLKKIYPLLYLVSDTLKDALIFHFKEVYGLDLNFEEKYKSEGDRFEVLFEKMRSLSNKYFPNEINKSVLNVSTKDINKKRYLNFEEESVKYTFPFGSRVDFLGSSDGFTRSFRMPFLAPKQ